MIYIEGEQVLLRGITENDVNDRYLNWINDFEVTSGLYTGYFPETMHTLRNYIQSILQNNTGVMFAILYKQNNEHIGNVKLDQIHWPNRNAEMGIMIGDKNYWGKGLGTEICNLTVNYAFETLNLRKITLTVFSNNPGAIKLYKKIGFIEEGCLKEHVFKGGEYLDKYVMSKFKDK